MGSMGTMYQAKLDFNLPLFTRSRQRAAVLEQVSEVDRARRSYQATGNQMLFRIKDDWLQSSASWRLMRLYSTTMVPQATITLESSLTAYENGQIDFMNVLASLMSVLDAEMAYHEESLNYHLALLRLEETAGVPLVNDDPPENAPGGQTTGTGNGLTDTVNHRSLTLAAPFQTGAPSFPGAVPKEEQR
jgi:outer membrane protein TolC